jgi:hypothetical protein
MQTNFDSPEWQAVFDHATNQIQEHAQSLLSTHCDQQKSDFLRGQIEALRELIERDKVRYKQFSINIFS